LFKKNGGYKIEIVCRILHTFYTRIIHARYPTYELESLVVDAFGVVQIREFTGIVMAVEEKILVIG
jgi:hypothetical protein